MILSETNTENLFGSSLLISVFSPIARSKKFAIWEFSRLYPLHFLTLMLVTIMQCHHMNKSCRPHYEYLALQHTKDF